MGSLSYTFLTNFSKSVKLSLMVATGYAISLTTTYIISTFSISPNKYFFLIFLCFSLAGVGFSAFRLHDLKVNEWEIHKNTFRNLRNVNNLIFIIPIISILAPVIIPLTNFMRSGYFEPVFTQGNNDVAQFVLEAEAIIRGGFNGHNFVLNQNQFIFARDNDFGAPNFILWVSKFDLLKTWQTPTPILSITNLLLFFGVSGAICYRFKLSRYKSYAISLLVTSGAVVLYLDSNLFLSQVISMWLWSNIIILFLSVRQSKSKSERRNLLLLIGVNFSGCFFTYPHMAIITFCIYILSVLVLFFWKRRTEIKNLDDKLGAYIYYPLLVLILMCNIYLGPGLRLFIYRASASNGWPMPKGLSIANLLLVADYSGKYQTFFEILSIGLLLFLIEKVFKQTQHKHLNFEQKIQSLVWVTIPIFLYLTLAILFGVSSYKAWKVLFSFAPFILSGFVLQWLIFMPKRKQKIFWRYLPLGMVLLIIPMVRQYIPIVQNHTLYSQRTTSKDLYDLNSNSFISNVNSINVKLNPFFESMYASSIIQVPNIYINVASYAPIRIESNTCTLVRNDALNVKSELGYVHRLNSTYSIINSPSVCQFKK